MPKHIVYTKITPLAANVPRQLALDMLHAHGEIIELNPLVTGHKPISAPRDAARDEYFAQWYEIEEIITWGFGMKKRIAFKGCFHDMPWGLQTHIYAPLGVDLRNKYTIAGNQPGEPKEVRELGVDAPAEGLYLKEDVEITCNIALAGFVKKETKQTLLTMIERMTRKAELLDDGVLHAMFEGGRLKTINPAQPQRIRDSLRPPSTAITESMSTISSPVSPALKQQDFSPSPPQTFTKYSNLPGRTVRGSQSSTQGFTELDSSPGSDSKSFPLPQPLNNAVEMEGSTRFPLNGKDRYPYQGIDTPTPLFHAELADTSSSTTTRRLSTISYNHSERPTSTVASSMYSHHSSEAPRYGIALTTDTPSPSSVHMDRSDRPRAASGINYSITNADHPAFRHSAPYPDGPDDYPPSEHRCARDSKRAASSSTDLGLADKPTGLDITGVENSPRISRCPMDKCDFEGDSTAISHHVNRQHFG